MELENSVNSVHNRIILWFRNDLRIHDNYIIFEALKLIKEGIADEVIPLYCFDPRFFDVNVLDRKTSLTGEPKMGPFRAQFLLQSVLDLKKNLKMLGSDLVLKVGKPENIISQYIKDEQQGSTVVLTQVEPTYEEQFVDKKVSQAIGDKRNLKLIWGSTLFHIDDLPLRPDVKDLPDVFTQFRFMIEEKCRPRDEVPTPRKGELPLPQSISPSDLKFIPTWNDLPLHPKIKSSPSPLPPSPKSAMHQYGGFKGGESQALRRLEYYIWDQDLLKNYVQTRNGMLGDKYSSKFAPWLAHGCLSPRRIFTEIQKYENERVRNKSTYWLVLELMWRDWFKFFALKHGTRMFFEGGTLYNSKRWNQDMELFQKWKDGMTGMPLVDANMRELKATGFMSNRGRQNVASYLVLEIGIDWRLGADWFEHHLIDYDTASNWGNWVAAAGLTGGRLNQFNITNQSKHYDPDGTYIKHWIPELRGIPGTKVHEPWQISKADQEFYGVIIGRDYPERIPDTKLMAAQDIIASGVSNPRHKGRSRGLDTKVYRNGEGKGRRYGKNGKGKNNFGRYK